MTRPQNTGTAAQETKANGCPVLTIGIVAPDHQMHDIAVTLGALNYSGRLEILIVNSGTPDRSEFDLVRGQISTATNVRYVLWQPGTAAVNTIFTEAGAEWVLFLRPGTRLHLSALTGLVEFATTHPEYADLLQGPMSTDPQSPDYTELAPVWHHGRFGVPAEPHSPNPTAQIVEVGMQDLGVFACRKDCWPGIDPRLGMSEGPPGYLHKKFRARGHRTLCLPFLRWNNTATHIAQHPTHDAEQFFRYLLCWEDTGEAVEPILAHFTERRGEFWVEQHLAHWQAGRDDPFDAFDAMVCINSDRQPERWSRVTARFAALGIAGKVQRLPATLTPQRYPIGCALSHRRAVAMARQQGMDNILVFEDDAVFLQGTTWVLRHSVRELMALPWKLFYLGGFYSDQKNPLGTDGPAPAGTFLRHAPGLVCLHAIAYHRRVFDQILDELPADPDAMGDFLDGYGGHIDVYYAETFNDGVYRASPTIATQESYIHLEHPYLRDQFLATPTPETNTPHNIPAW
ncbi:hypothetical protein [Nocardia sp. NPDC050175]|uniref:hypothetical protein n=1 Tax=Nocardia sp. NPDC050175 TaxID=3364317 RepID=UPI0037B0C9B9